MQKGGGSWPGTMATPLQEEGIGASFAQKYVIGIYYYEQFLRAFRLNLLIARFYALTWRFLSSPINNFVVLFRHERRSLEMTPEIRIGVHLAFGDTCIKLPHPNQSLSPCENSPATVQMIDDSQSVCT